MSQTEKGAMDHPERVRVAGAEEEGLEEDARRPLPPIVFPLAALVFTVILVWALSRVLLAVPHDIAPIIALLVAANVLVGSALVAYGGRVRRRPVSFPLLMFAGVAVVAVGAFASTIGGPEVEGEHAGGGAPAVTVTARNLEFDKERLTLPANQQVSIRFENNDSGGVQHNIAIFRGNGPEGDVVFRGRLVAAPGSTTYTFDAPPPGSYYFHCDVHPNMNGTVTVEGGEAGGEGTGDTGEGTGDTGETGEGTQLVAQNIAFDPTELTIEGGGEATIQFENKDQAPHNVAIFEGNGPTGDVVFRGDVVTGPTTTTYTFEAPPPGRYFFHCDVHPQMKGSVTVT